jgi:Recombinase
VVVRRILELCATGLGVTRIAKAEHAPPPRTAGGWAPAAVREMLNRPLYRGEVVWSRTQRIDRGGTGMVSPTGHVHRALLVRAYVLLSTYAALSFETRGKWRVKSSS